MGSRGPKQRTAEQVCQAIRDNSIDVADCKHWQGHTAAGYGVIGYKGRQVFIHRFVFEQENNIRLETADVVRHKCDVKICWEPSHLVKGTHADNVADKVAKERQMRGRDHYKSYLTEDNVRAIRASEEPYPVLSKRYGISRGGISNIKHRKTWRHVA